MGDPARQASKVDLILWDFNSDEHIDRAYLQRIACGWRAEEIPDWKEKSKKGTIGVYWLVLKDDIPDCDELIAKHITKYPTERLPIKDTSTTIFTPHIRAPSNKLIHPIGHVAITLPSASELEALSLPPEGVAYIGKLYVSYAIQGGGIRGTAMRGVENISRDILGCDLAILDTVASEFQMNPETLDGLYVKLGNPIPKISNEDWYRKMGYVEFLRDQAGYMFKHPLTGIIEPLPVIYVKKSLSNIA